jgi:hypothetical protein
VAMGAISGCGMLSWSLAEGLEKTLTLYRLGVFPELGTSFKTTNLLESVMARVEADVLSHERSETTLVCGGAPPPSKPGSAGSMATATYSCWFARCTRERGVADEDRCVTTHS